MNSDVFISYDPSDASFVNQLCQALQASGLSTWVEGHDLPPASDRATALAEAIQASPLFLLIVSPAAAASTALADQLALAKGEGKIILSLLWQQTDLPPAWKLHLSGTQPLAFHGLASSENLARLTRLVIERLGQAALDQALVGLPPPVGPESLAVAEQAYRQRLKEKYAADAAYFIPLTGQTTEVGTAPAPESRAARRRRQRAQADLCQWVQAGQELRRVKLDSLAEAVDKYPCVILLGEPGSGKTTALEHLAYELVGPSPLQLRSGQAQPSPLPTLPPSYLPLPLRLSEFSPGLTVEEFIVQSWAGATTAGHWQAPELAANLTAYLEAGRLLILFDALNEMPHSADTPARSQALRRFITTWAATGNRFLVTCRVLDYGEALTGLQRVELQPLDDGQIQAFLLGEIASEDDRCAVLWQELSTTEDGDHRADLRERLNTELEDRGLQTKLQDFWLALTRGDDQRRLLELARNPYLLTVMVEIYAEDGRLGRNRAELMARFSQMLLEWAKRKCDPQEWLDEEVQQAALSITAFEMQARAGSGARVETGKVKSVMPQTVQPDPNWPPRPAPPDQVLTLAANAHILEMPVDRASVRFYHQLLQEYFAARELLTRMRPPSVPPSTLPRSSGRGPARGEEKPPLPLGEGWGEGLDSLWRWPWLENEMPRWIRPENNNDPLPPPPPTGWEETTILAAGLVENDHQLVRILIEINPVLAGRCLHEGRAVVDSATRQAVIEALLQTIARPEVALRVRIAAGEVLGYLGDPRLGELVTIPAGEFWMGDDQSTQANEKPQHRLFLSEYQIGKYPVTHCEFDRFIEAGGYREPRWWTKQGWYWRNWKRHGDHTEPYSWFNSWFNQPNQPAYGITWFEAVAYCRWLSAETGQLYRLPTEAEWEKAARGSDGRTYPWGNNFDGSCLNLDVGLQQVKATTSVGIYPSGVSPYGLFDCAGNVWEWCATKALGSAMKQYPYDLTENEWAGPYLEGNEGRVLRSGAFSYHQDVARCAHRSRHPANDGYDAIGFRLVSPSF